MSSAEIERAGYRLSPQQRQLWRWMAEEREPYRALAAVRLSGELRVDWLEAAIKEVVQRHEILRTKVEMRRLLKLSVQVIEAEGECEFSYVEQGAGRDLYEELREEAQGSGSGLRVALARVSEREHEMVLRVGGMSADEAGMRVLVEEVARSYEAHLSGAAHEDEVLQYITVSEWLNEMLDSQEMEAGREFWRKQDLSKVMMLKLPFEISNDAEALEMTKSFEGRCDRKIVGPEVSRKILEVAAEHQAPEWILFLACWQILVWRINGQMPVTIGLGCDGRTDAELKQLLGLLKRYVPLHFQIDGTRSFSELLLGLNKTAGELAEWQEFFTWEQITSADNESTLEPFFPLCFDYTKLPAPFAVADLTFSIERVEAAHDRFSLKLSTTRKENTFHLDWHYDSSRMSASQIEELGNQFEALLESAINNPSQPANRLNILSSRQRQQMLELSAGAKAVYASDKTLQQAFEEQVERSPQSVAVVFEEEQLTYTQLNARANQLAHHLRSMGVAADVLVGICMERSLEMAVALLGILKAGGAYVPLDPAYPEQRLAFMLEDSGTSVVLTQGALKDKLSVHSARLICLDTEWRTIAAYSTDNPNRNAIADNLAYVIYTSGSTGTPKGAMLPHRGIMNCIYWMQDTYRLDESDRFLLKTSLNFDPSVWEFFWTLFVGAQGVIAKPDGHQDSAYLVETIIRHGITTVYYVPAMLLVFLKEIAPGSCTSLKRVICGGDSLPTEGVRDFFTRLGAELHHSYGPTETSIAATEWVCDRYARSPRVPIGRPLANTESYILDQQMEPVPIGVAGELYLGGVGLARGYQQQAGLTAERFVPHPYARVEGARLYRTGDVARYRGEGAIEFLGRVDHQVKLRGYRIELGEIESVLRQHEGVSEAVVVVRGAGVEQRLVGYVTAAERNGAGGRELSRRLREYLQGRVPEYMVPAALMVLERMPLSANGKLDRAALPEPDSGPGGRAEREGPRNATEALIAEVWQQVLGLESVSVHDNFFELGGDSILGIQVVARLRQAGLVLTPRQLFQHQSSAALAQVAGALGRVAASQESGATEESGAAVVLTPIQRRFFAESGAEKHHWNQAVLLASRERLEPERLRRVVAALVARHDALRLRYEQESDGEWRQYVAGVEGAGVPLTSIDLRALGETVRAALEAAAAAAQGSLDLSAGPLLRVVHFRLGESAGERLLLIIHHLAVDGVSWRVLLEELERGYRQSGEGGEIGLGARELSFREWAQQL